MVDALESVARLRFARISPQKARLIANMIRGRNVEDAKRILQFTPRKGAEIVLKLLQSVIANAEGKNVEDPEILKVFRIWVDQGPVHRRNLPRARGRADTIRKPTSHITIIAQEDLKAKEEASKRQAEIEAKREKKRAARKAAAEKVKTEDAGVSKENADDNKPDEEKGES